MKIRNALVLLWFLPALVAGPAVAEGENVLVVLLDDLGVDQLSVYDEGTDYAATPTVDVLASEGILFRNVWSAPVCTPTRATMMTGRRGFRTGVLWVMAENLGFDERTLPEVMKDASLNPGLGYADAAIGKWHLGGGMSGPNTHGFSHYAGRLAVPDSYFEWDRTVNGVTQPCFEGSAACPDVSYMTTVEVNDAIDWLEDQTEPWFLYMAFDAPHDPFHVPPHELVTPETLARLPRVGGAPAPPGTTCMGAFRRPCYHAAIEAADTELARLLDTITEPTHIILLGDNGTPTQTSESPFESDHAKGSLYEGGVNVPMIVRTADLQSPNTESQALIHTVDLFATVLELMGAAGPTDRAIDSRSIVPLFADPSLPWNETVYTENHLGQAIREERFKLIRMATHDELYDLEGDLPQVAADPFETNDLLAGSCSGSAAVCHVDADCPAGQACDVAALTPEAQAAFGLLSFRMERLLSPASGSIPATLRLDAAPNGDIALAWEPSCTAGDFDYAIYEGTLGDFESHVAVTCSTEGASATEATPAAGSTYYLIVPSNDSSEGAYGSASDGTPRLATSTSCLPQLAEACDP